jgi:hypothetical protein
MVRRYILNSSTPLRKYNGSQKCLNGSILPLLPFPPPVARSLHFLSLICNILCFSQNRYLYGISDDRVAVIGAANRCGHARTSDFYEFFPFPLKNGAFDRD